MICPVCNSHDTVFRGTIDRFEEPFSIRLCLHCQSSYQFPSPTVPDQFYSSEYYSGKANYSYIDERKTNRYAQHVWQARLKTILKFQKQGTFLDVGCSFGGFVRAASHYFEAFGIDISEYAIHEGNKFAGTKDETGRFKGLFKGSLQDIPPEVKQAVPFNVISMIEVAEHLEKPALHFQNAHSLLAPGGILVIQTANMTAIQAVRQGLNYHYFLPGHLTYFSRSGLTDLLKATGFKSVVEYFPVDFGILPKLLKMRGNITRFKDYFKMWKTIQYHFSSRFWINGIPRTSSYVVYAIK